jgi:hypothetical protein
MEVYILSKVSVPIIEPDQEYKRAEHLIGESDQEYKGAEHFK